jgi:PHD/YefM family antitoxin component YafN of YafNO toxin-antitoxin module
MLKQPTPSFQTRINRLRYKFLSIPQASQQLQTLARKIIKEQRRALIHIDGKKAAVLISYDEYQQIEQLRTQQMKFDALQQLNALITRRSGQVT